MMLSSPLLGGCGIDATTKAVLDMNKQLPKWIRTPTKGVCEWTGLSRGKIYQLIGGKSPKVKSASVTSEGRIRGVRLINLQSLLDYIDSCYRRDKYQ
jgi:hypothetical protein